LKETSPREIDSGNGKSRGGGERSQGKGLAAEYKKRRIRNEVKGKRMGFGNEGRMRGAIGKTKSEDRQESG
jgi:hypothetical protein